MKTLIPSLLLITSFSFIGCKQMDEAKGPPRTDPQTSYGKAVQSGKLAKSNQEERDKELEEQAHSLSDE